MKTNNYFKYFGDLVNRLPKPSKLVAKIFGVYEMIDWEKAEENPSDYHKIYDSHSEEPRDITQRN